MTSRKTLLCLALTALAASSPAQDAPLFLPRIDTARIAPAADGLDPRGASWRSWVTTDPAGTMTASTPEQAVGVVRASAAWVPTLLATSSGAPDRVVACELALPDANAPDGIAGAIAIFRTQAPGTLARHADTQLVRLVAPSVDLPAAAPRLLVAPLVAAGSPLGPGQGLEGFAVMRATVGSSTWTEVGRMPASAGVQEWLDMDVPAGEWRYALRAVFVPEVVSLVASPASAPVTVMVNPGSCEEPGARDLDPTSPPLLLARAGSEVRATWTAPAGEFDVYAGSLAALRAGGYDHGRTTACRVASSEATFALAPGGYALVARHCAGGLSSLGRDSNGIARPLPSNPCP